MAGERLARRATPDGYGPLWPGLADGKGRRRMRSHPHRHTDTGIACAYLVPREHWALPLRDAFEHDPQDVLDQAFVGQPPGEHTAVMFVIEPVKHGTHEAAWRVADGLRAGIRPSAQSLSRQLVRGTLGNARYMLASIMGAEQAYTTAQRRTTPHMLEGARAVIAKARSPLLRIQILIRVVAPTKAQAKAQLAFTATTFSQYTGPFNRLVAHRPWRQRKFDRVFQQQGSWPGASFVVSAAEAAALTGRPTRDLALVTECDVILRTKPLAVRAAACEDHFLGELSDGRE